jgi:hypothetical protein
MAALFSPKMPETKPTAPLPDDMSPGVLEARRRQRSNMMGRGGRADTMLSEGEDRGIFTGTKLGG